jgi:hypothetical protein
MTTFSLQDQDLRCFVYQVVRGGSQKSLWRHHSFSLERSPAGRHKATGWRLLRYNSMEFSGSHDYQESWPGIGVGLHHGG